MNTNCRAPQRPEPQLARWGGDVTHAARRRTRNKLQEVHSSKLISVRLCDWFLQSHAEDFCHRAQLLRMYRALEIVLISDTEDRNCPSSSCPAEIITAHWLRPNRQDALLIIHLQTDSRGQQSAETFISAQRQSFTTSTKEWLADVFIPSQSRILAVTMDITVKERVILHSLPSADTSVGRRAPLGHLHSQSSISLRNYFRKCSNTSSSTNDKALIDRKEFKFISISFET